MHEDFMARLKKRLEDNGMQVFRPKFEEALQGDWYLDKDGKIFEFVFDIDANQHAWVEVDRFIWVPMGREVKAPEPPSE